MRTLLRPTFLAAGLAVLAASAHAAEPTEPVPDADRRYAPSTPSMLTAVQIAVGRWGYYPCGGQVAFSWRPMAPGTNATSSWTNDTAAYGVPDRNAACEIAFSSTAPFDWTKFCTVMVHEMGHLAGHAHSPNPGDIMAEYYDAPEPTCARTPDPSGYLPRGHGSSSVASVMKVVRRRSTSGRARAAAVIVRPARTRR